MSVLLRRIPLALFSTVLLFGWPVLANAKRVALLIGNDNYQFVSKLQKARNDARSMAEELRAAGFEVRLETDLSYLPLVRAVNGFTQTIQRGDEVVVFYAGHGVQLKTGNYILPIDINAETETEVELTALSLDSLTETLGRSEAAYTLVIVDACRDNPLQSRGRAMGGTRGLLPVEPVKGQLVVYSAGRGQQALDRLSRDDSDPNGVFTREFLARIRTAGVRIQDLVRDVQDAVEGLAKSVNHEQRPAIYDESRGDFYFYPPVPGAKQNGVIRSDDPLREDAFWADAKGLGTRDGFDAYLQQYPNGRYVSLARANLSKLNGMSRVPAEDRQALLDELEMWNRAKKSGREADYAGYLGKYPGGYFASLAEDLLGVITKENNILAMEKGSDEDRERAREEKSLVAASRQEIAKEEAARRRLISSLLRLDAPTF